MENKENKTEEQLAIRNSRIINSKMVLLGVSINDYAKAQGWSMSTVHRKVNSKSLYTSREIRVAKDLLQLTLDDINKIFLGGE